MVGYLIKILPLPDEEFSMISIANAKQSKLVNYEQWEIDFDELKCLELELLIKHRKRKGRVDRRMYRGLLLLEI